MNHHMTSSSTAILETISKKGDLVPSERMIVSVRKGGRHNQHYNGKPSFILVEFVAILDPFALKESLLATWVVSDEPTTYHHQSNLLSPFTRIHLRDYLIHKRSRRRLTNCESLSYSCIVMEPGFRRTWCTNVKGPNPPTERAL